MTFDKDGLGLVADGKSPVESGLCHIEWAVPDDCDGIIEKAQETEEPFGSEVRTHTEPESMETTSDALPRTAYYFTFIFSCVLDVRCPYVFLNDLRLSLAVVVLKCFSQT